MSRDISPRGGQFAAIGEDAIAASCDRKINRGAGTAGERDWCDTEGALNLADRIEEWWARRGRIVKCRIEPGGFGTAAVRSDLGLVLPARAERR